MGEVFRARDTRLRRDVALKILPDTVSADAASRARFEREAHAAAALNHPNILAVYDVGRENGVVYIATELVNGETLATLLKRGPLPSSRSFTSRRPRHLSQDRRATESRSVDFFGERRYANSADERHHRETPGDLVARRRVVRVSQNRGRQAQSHEGQNHRPGKRDPPEA
jgi:hypothetical protein